MGTIYSMAPGYQPRKANAICEQMCERFKSANGSKHLNHDLWFWWVDGIEDAEKFIRELLMPIPEFQELNLSNAEYSAGIAVDDPERPEFAFISRYDGRDEDNDFIDLDACVRNICMSWRRIIRWDEYVLD